MNDQTLTCRDCGQPFTFTSSEQEFYASRGFSEPVRCPDCRAARKAEREGGSGGGGYSGGGAYGGRREREMFAAVCDSCGKETQVPFRPTNGKPVYCSDCFRQRGGGAGGGGGANRTGGGYGGRSGGGYGRDRY